MKKIVVGIIVSSLFISFTLLSGTGCGPSEAIKSLAAIEVKEYQGENLGSIADFRNNSIKGSQYVDADSYRLDITGLVENDKSYTYDDVLSGNEQYKKVVTLNCVEGWSVKILWEGMLVNDVIREANPLSNASVVIFHAYDGYTTSLHLEYITGNDIMIAHKMNELTLPPERGFPFQLVAESKWGYKWIKWITKIELSDDVNYKGYWESSGYSNSGDLNKGFFK